MNRSSTSLKSILVVLFAGLLIFNLIILSSFTAKATEGEGDTCRWTPFECPGWFIVERCVVDGDGNSCTCGAVTRECP